MGNPGGSRLQIPRPNQHQNLLFSPQFSLSLICFWGGLWGGFLIPFSWILFPFFLNFVPNFFGFFSYFPRILFPFLFPDFILIFLGFIPIFLVFFFSPFFWDFIPIFLVLPPKKFYSKIFLLQKFFTPKLFSGGILGAISQNNPNFSQKTPNPSPKNPKSFPNPTTGAQNTPKLP